MIAAARRAIAARRGAANESAEGGATTTPGEGAVIQARSSDEAKAVTGEERDTQRAGDVIAGMV